jgi:hypothetical protein
MPVLTSPSGTSRASAVSRTPPICYEPCFLLLPRARDPVRSIAVGPGGRPAPEVSGAEGGGHRARRRCPSMNGPADFN